MIQTLPKGSRVIFATDDPADVFHVLPDGRTVIMNPHRPARIVSPDGTVRPLQPAEYAAHELFRYDPKA
jgi:hypothetical protein